MINNTLKLPNGYVLTISLTDNPSKIQYQITDSEKNLISNVKSGLPASMSNRSQVMKDIKNCITNGRKVSGVDQELNKIKTRMQKLVSELQGEAEYLAIQEQQEQELEIRKKVHEAENLLKSLDNPLLYIGSIIDWLTAGERINTLICFTAGCSQIILRKPISVIGYGESSSGKTYIESVALSLLPSDFIVFEKQASPAAIFNRARNDEYFYDGKIVMYGDMGGQNDRENSQESLDLMKELQSDGELTKPVSVKDDSNKWSTEELILKGFPALWYTTVPVDIDNQELSRAIVFTPRTDNREIFNKRGKALSFKRGRTHNLFLEVKMKSEIIPYMVKHLRDVMEDYIVINPFFDIISGMLEQSKFFKRDTEKYISLLETITVINFYQNEKYEFEDGQKAVLTSKDDVQLLLSMLEPYMHSIAVNIKPKSAEIYQILLANIDDWKLYKGSEEYEFDIGITIREYFEKPVNDIPMSSLRRYFSDLYQAGLLSIVGTQERANMYDVVKYDFDKLIHEIDYDKLGEDIEFELGLEIAQIIRNDEVTDGLNISEKHDLIGDTLW